MQVSKEKLIIFLDENVLIPAENHPQTTEVIKKKVRTTRMRLNNLSTPEQVEEFFWSAMASDNGIDSYTKIKDIGAKTFEDVRLEFKKLCGRK
jgi:folylpolyglutamate synthase/dihydropteroate synthase